VGVETENQFENQPGNWSAGGGVEVLESNFGGPGKQCGFCWE